MDIAVGDLTTHLADLRDGPPVAFLRGGRADHKVVRPR
jgi:hypothetical protein